MEYLTPLILGLICFALVFYNIKLKKDNKVLRESIQAHLNKEDIILENAKVKAQKIIDEAKEKTQQEIQDALAGLSDSWEEQKQRNQELFDLQRQALDNALAKYRSEQVAIINTQLDKTQQEKEELLQQLEIRIEETKEDIDSLRSAQASINNAIRAATKAEQEEDFARIVINSKDQNDIEVMETLIPRLNNPDILRKLIYESYVRRPLTEMTKRLLPDGKVCGVYKIDYIGTGQSYVGQSTDVKKRWTEHVKSSFGIGSIASSTFHTFLAEKGVWNFHFHLLEEVPKDKLRERESYWIDYYDTVNVGLNMKR